LLIDQRKLSLRQCGDEEGAVCLRAPFATSVGDGAFILSFGADLANNLTLSCGAAANRFKESDSVSPIGQTCVLTLRAARFMTQRTLGTSPGERTSQET
jgi:hypothetical protein